MGGHSALDQATLKDLWKIAQDCEKALKGHVPSYKNIYIRTNDKRLEVRYEDGILSWFGRLLKRKQYQIAPNTATAILLKELHNKTCDLSEAALIKAIDASTLCKGGVAAYDVLTKIKAGCRTLNSILQHTLERKLEKAQEVRQEGIKHFFSGLFLPSWDLKDARKAEIARAQEEFRRAQAQAVDAFTGIVQKIQGYLDAALAQLNVAMTGKEEAETILSNALNAHTVETIQQAALRVKECTTSAEEAVMMLKEITKQADDLVKREESKEQKPILNFGEIEELKKFREIVNVAGQAEEYANSAKIAASQVEKLASK